MMTIKTRNTGSGQKAAAVNPIPSTFQIGDIVTFAPCATWPRPGGVYVSWVGLDALVVGVKFEKSKVLYDLAMKDDSGGFYIERPLKEVDSIFIEHTIPTTPGLQYLQP